MKKLLLLLLVTMFTLPIMAKKKRSYHFNEAIVSTIDENTNFNEMSEKELFHFMFENSFMIRPIKVTPQDTARKEISDYERYRLEKEMQEHPTLFNDDEISPAKEIQYKWNADEVKSITIFQGKSISVFVDEESKIKRIVGLLNSLNLTVSDFNEESPDYQISMDVYEDIYIFGKDKVMIGDTKFVSDKRLDQILRNLVREMEPVNAKSTSYNDVYVYHNYSRFFRPYFMHSWYYSPWYFGSYYDYWYYDWHYDPWYYGYGYPYYRYYSYWNYPYYRPYPIYYSYNRPLNGRHYSVLGKRYYRNYATNVRSYNSGRTPKYATKSTSMISRRTTQISSTVSPMRRNQTVQTDVNVLRRNQRTDVPTVRGNGNADNRRLDVNVLRRNQNTNVNPAQRKSYQDAVRSGERTYNPTYSNPRMSKRPVYNSNNRLYRNRTTIQNNSKGSIVTPQRRSSVRTTVPVPQNRSTYRSGTTSSRSSVTRSSTRSSVSRSSGSVSRSSGSVSRSSGKSSSGGRGRR